MTNSDRAEKILKWLFDRGYSPAIGFSELVTSQLEGAVREAKLNGIAEGWVYGNKEGFAAAREKAAGIAESTLSIHGVQIARGIRAMDPYK